MCDILFKMKICQRCVMSPWLFNIYMDGVVKEVNDESPLLRFGFGDDRRLRLKYVRYCER